jgi:hypothetical protein
VSAGRTADDSAVEVATTACLDNRRYLASRRRRNGVGVEINALKARRLPRDISCGLGWTDGDNELTSVSDGFY